MRKALGLFICFVGIAISIFWASEWNFIDAVSFIDIATTFSIVVPAAGFIIGTGSFKAFIAGINCILSKKYRITEKLLDEAVSLFELLAKVVVNATVVSIFIGLCLTLLNLDDPASLGPKISIALLAALHGAFINLVFIHPAIYMLKKKRTEEPLEDNDANIHAVRARDREAVDKLLQLCFEKGITREDIMNADGIDLRKKLQ
jgi:flagellar motor component MotA